MLLDTTQPFPREAIREETRTWDTERTVLTAVMAAYGADGAPARVESPESPGGWYYGVIPLSGGRWIGVYLPQGHNADELDLVVYTAESDPTDDFGRVPNAPIATIAAAIREFVARHA